VIGRETFGAGLGSTTFVAYIAHTTLPAYTAIQVASWQDAAPSSK
jgi:hypothetical protein